MWEMGGYGIYIWPSFALVLGGLLLILVQSAYQSNRLKKQIKARN